ncbi:hypothetical protein MYX78_12565, partial [Acidobacteria bacterium AH-259-G07]|nr:hypothetical protein [Acidobacteria bacterium AH-259-G07]
MPDVIVPKGGVTNLSALIEAMFAKLRSYWTQAESYQKFLYSVGTFLLLSAVFHTGVLIVTGGSLEGDISWRKPILFGEAFGLTCLSVAWIMTFLPKRPVSGWLLAATLSMANFGEVLWVAMQQWRGVPSHFNNSTPFDAAAFTAAGILIFFTGIVIVVVTLATFLSLKVNRSLAWAIRISMVLLFIAQAFGVLIIANGGSTFGEEGAMKIPHALSLHAPQVLPVLAWLLLFTNCSESRRTRIVIVGAGGYMVLIAVSAFQTFNGLAPFKLDPAVGMLLGIGVIMLGAAYMSTLVALRRTLTQGAHG